MEKEYGDFFPQKTKQNYHMTQKFHLLEIYLKKSKTLI